MSDSLERKPFSKILEGQRIQLIEALPMHADQLWQSILKDRQEREFSWRWLDSVDDLKKYLSENFFDKPTNEVVYLFQKENQIFGTFHIHTINYSDHKTEIGYAIEKSFEGHGYVHEAVTLIEQELKRLGFKKIVIKSNLENTKSIRVAEKANFNKEGIFLKDCLEHGQFRDTIVFGKLL